MKNTIGILSSSIRQKETATMQEVGRQVKDVSTVPTKLGIFQELAQRPRRPSEISLNKDEPYHTIGMHKTSGYEADGVVDGKSQFVNYLNEQQRGQYQVSFLNGLLFQSSTHGQPQPMNTTKKIVPQSGGGFEWDFDEDEQSQPVQEKNIDDRYLFVMDSRGRIYAAHEDEVQHHSSFLAGEPVAAAGTVRVKDGRVIFINDESGHYRPTTDHTLQVLQTLEDSGVDISDIDIEILGVSKQRAQEMGVSNERYYGTNFVKKPY